MTQQSGALRVLVVDDEEGFRDLLRWELASAGMAVQTATSGDEGVDRLNESTFDVVVTDITMPKMDGLKLLQHVKETSPQTEVIVASAPSRPPCTRCATAPTISF